MKQILDHGFVDLIETWGSDQRIIEAARQSTDKGFLGWGPRLKAFDSVGTPVLLTPWQEEKIREGSGLVAQSMGVTTWEEAGPGDEKLLRYLYEHKHSTPFEFGGMTIQVQAPIMVFREWHRHRTQCLDGATPVRLVTPAGSTCTRTIKEIYDLKHGGVVDRMGSYTKNGFSKNGTPVFRKARYRHPERVRILPNCQQRTLRVLDEESGEYVTAQMADVWVSGEKELFEVRTESGLVVRASAEHPFLTKDGWAKLKDLGTGDLLTTHGKVALKETPIPRRLRDAISGWTSMMRIRLIPVDGARCHVCSEWFQQEELELDHVIPVSVDLARALDHKNLQPACRKCHRQKTDNEQPDRREQTGLGVRYARLSGKPKRVAEGVTYDMEVAGKNHNYMAGELVVHNSYAEMSARYVQMPNLHYVPSVERIIESAKKSGNRQASGGGALLTTIPGQTQEQAAEAIRQELIREQQDIYDRYERLISYGVAKEVARIDTPVSRYSRMYATTDLRNWLAFLTLRMDPMAQWEIRQYANAVGDLIAEAFPRTWELFSSGQNG